MRLVSNEEIKPKLSGSYAYAALMPMRLLCLCGSYHAYTALMPIQLLLLCLNSFLCDSPAYVGAA